MITDIKSIRKAIENHKKTIAGFERRIAADNLTINQQQEEMHRLQQIDLYLSEIKRLARLHLPRLRGRTGFELTEEDNRELKKWVSRAESLNDLKKVMDALAELEKYSPAAVSNPYGLVQSIIIEGAYGKRKKSKKS